MNLRGRMRLLTQFKWAISVYVLIGLAGAYASSNHQPKLYHGSATLLARTLPTGIDVFGVQQNAPAVEVQDRNVATQIAVLESPAVKAALVETLPNAPDVKGIQIAHTNEFRAQVSSTDPKLAAASATGYARAYVNLQRSQSVTDITAAAASVRTEVESLQQTISDLQAQIDQRTRSDVVSHTELQSDLTIALLQQQHQGAVQEQALFQTKLSELNVNAQLKQSLAVVVSSAKQSTVPYSPRPGRSALLAAFAALVSGIALAHILHYLDDTIRSAEDVQSATHGLAVLGVFPKLWRRDRANSIHPISQGITSGGAEAFRFLRTHVQFLSSLKGTTSLLVTSPSKGEGKTTLVGNLALAMGRGGQRVVVIDADMRKPLIHQFFGLDGQRGLSQLLSGTLTLAEAIQQVPGEPNLRVMPAGPIPSNPSELLASQWTRLLVAALEGQCDQLIIDAPPLLPVTDSATLALHVDACILVAKAGQSRTQDLSRATLVLRQVRAPLLGIVVNDYHGCFSDANWNGPEETRYASREHRVTASPATTYHRQSADHTTFLQTNRVDVPMKHPLK